MAATSSPSPNEATQAQAAPSAARQDEPAWRVTQLPTADEVSEHTHRVVDAEVRRIVEAAYAEVSALLREHRDQLDALADRLMQNETLDEVDAYAAAGIDHAHESVPRSPDERNRP